MGDYLFPLFSLLGALLAFEVIIGNKWVIISMTAALSVVVLVGYPALAHSGLVSAHGLMGKVLFYISFVVSYFLVLSFAFRVVSDALKSKRSQRN